jgi:8-hydroxy-5-deazaflavin:NADPH oxidoreductase
MKIGIIGAGNIGGTLTRRLTELGHKVFVANSRGPETLVDLAAETGATPVTVEQAAQAGDVVIVTIPLKNIPSLPAGLFAKTPKSVVVVDTSNYYPQQRDGRIDGIENGMTETRWVEQQLGRPVVKAFNNIYAEHLGTQGRPAGRPGRIALPIAGEDHAAKAIVLRLIDELGFDGVELVAWMNPGGNNPARRSMPQISTPMVCDVPLRKRARSANRSGATPRSSGTYEAPA